MLKSRFSCLIISFFSFSDTGTVNISELAIVNVCFFGFAFLLLAMPK